MRLISREIGQAVVIGDDIIVRVEGIDRNKVRLGVLGNCSVRKEEPPVSEVHPPSKVIYEDD